MELMVTMTTINHFIIFFHLVSECQEYPDYTVVALYKRKVIGCAFMTPEAYITYIAVHPEWRDAGVATFMLYHLISVS